MIPNTSKLTTAKWLKNNQILLKEEDCEHKSEL